MTQSRSKASASSDSATKTYQQFCQLLSHLGSSTGQSLQISAGKDERRVFAAAFASILKTGDWIFLDGNLGAGKTSFVRALLQPPLFASASEAVSDPVAEVSSALQPAASVESAVDARFGVSSPTYTVVNSYSAPEHLAERFRAILHLDLYRLANPAEFLYLGLDMVLAPRDLILVEWPWMMSPQQWSSALRQLCLPAPVRLICVSIVPEHDLGQGSVGRNYQVSLVSLPDL
jgi:tRNA A37 threonylcarbamoyladenosine biosynthesis protein TsaE